MAAVLLRRIAAITADLANNRAIALREVELTARERQAAELIGTGLCDKEIAAA